MSWHGKACTFKTALPYGCECTTIPTRAGLEVWVLDCYLGTFVPVGYEYLDEYSSDEEHILNLQYEGDECIMSPATRVGGYRIDTGETLDYYFAKHGVHCPSGFIAPVGTHINVYNQDTHVVVIVREHNRVTKLRYK